MIKYLKWWWNHKHTWYFSHRYGSTYIYRCTGCTDRTAERL